MLRYIASISNFFSTQSDWSSRDRGVSKNAFRYETLEQRRVLAGISFDLGTGVVTITGSAGNDFSVVSVPRLGQIEVSLTGFVAQTFTTSEVNEIFFGGLEGDDFFHNQTSIRSVAEGGLGNDRFYVGSGNDELYGNEGNDILNGGAGNDLLDGNDDSDRILTGSGNDRAYGGTGIDTIIAESGSNDLYGGDGGDLIYGGSDYDQIWGEGGDDTISTGAGNNFVDGGAGNDLVNATLASSNILLGGMDNDRIFGGNGMDRIEGGMGDDILVGGDGSDTILAQEGNDSLRGGLQADYLDGGAGDDAIFGEDGDDELLGGDAFDRLSGGNGNDRMLGGEGNDVLNGNDGDDEIDGGNANDVIFGGNGADEIWAGAGNDEAYGQVGNDEVYGQDGNDILGGGDGDDILDGQEGDDILSGAAGNDRLYGGNGRDVLNGGDGNDGLFGGISGSKLLIDTAGKNRFLLAETATNQLSGFRSSDAQILFRNGLRNWSNVEISVVDESLHDIHMRAGNTRILRGTFTSRPVVFIKEFTLPSNRYGSNELATLETIVLNPVTGLLETQTYQEHQIRLPEWDELDTTANLNVRAEVAREIAYNWASDAAMSAAYAPLGGIFPRFANLSGWTNTEPVPSLIDQYLLSQDQQWWYFRNALFTESFATFNPAADFAASFKYYFDPRVNPADRILYQQKMEIIDELFTKLAPF